MINTPTLPPQAIMIQMINGKLISRSISIAADLGIADLLKDGARPIAELARATQSNEDALNRLLRMLASVGIFAELDEGLYGNNQLSEVLRTNIMGSVRDYARWLGTNVHWEIIRDMDHTIKTGEPSFLKTHPGKDPFEALMEYPEDQQVFQEAMTGLSLADGFAIASAYDWAAHDSIIDVGGGHGHLVAILAQQAPDTNFTVFDLPHVIAVTKKELAQVGAKNVQTIAGSFLESVPGPADVIIMKHIIHDWSDEKSIAILKNCKKALNPNGKIILCEMMITEGPESAGIKVMDIEMLVGPGGRERTEQEFAALFKAAGMKLNQVISTQTAVRLIEATIA